MFVEAEAAGEPMFYGRGAAVDPMAPPCLATSSGRPAPGGGRSWAEESAYADLPGVGWARPPTRYHISLDVADRPGVLAQVAAAFAAHGVSIETVRQQVAPGEGGRAKLIVVTHRATDAALAATVDALADLDSVDDVASVMRVEGA